MASEFALAGLLAGADKCPPTAIYPLAWGKAPQVAFAPPYGWDSTCGSHASYRKDRACGQRLAYPTLPLMASPIRGSKLPIRLPLQ